MTILFDTNIVLDVLLDRAPHASSGTHLFTYAAEGALRGLLGATTLTTVHYLARKAAGEAAAREQLGKLLLLFDVAPVNRAVLEKALCLAFADFEDAVLHEAGRQAGAEGIVTRDAKGFASASLPVYTPDELLHVLRLRAQR